MRRLAVALALSLPLVALAGPPVQVCNAAGAACAPVSATLGLTTKPLPGTAWTCGLAGLAATLTECQALAAGRTYYITDIVVGTTTATSGTYSIQSGTGTNCDTATAAVFPAAPGTVSSRYQAPIAANPVATISLRQPLVVTAAHAVCVIGVATNTININLSGYYLP